MVVVVASADRVVEDSVVLDVTLVNVATIAARNSPTGQR
jgi:hypothetical protein